MKADRSNRKLNTLQQASRHVNDMAAVVVTSTKHGQQQVSDQGEEKTYHTRCTYASAASLVEFGARQSETYC